MPLRHTLPSRRNSEHAIRWFQWITTPTESAELQRGGARICEASLDTHHAEYAVLHEITAAQAFAALSQAHGGG